jgi:DNA gyrase/topoisomerase IV subunit B
MTSAGGLAARIALHADCPLDDVATHRASFETPAGPIDVEVALAWLSMQWHASAAPVFHSFVNLERSASHGTHVDGLIDGITAFFGRGRRQHLVAGAVAAVAVVLSDVKWGNPRHDRLDSPEARAPVAEAVHIALTAWAAAHPAAATALRAITSAADRTLHLLAAPLTRPRRSCGRITRIACRSSARALDTPTPPTSSISPFALPE